MRHTGGLPERRAHGESKKSTCGAENKAITQVRQNFERQAQPGTDEMPTDVHFLAG